MELDLRSIKGIGPAMAEKLKSAGIHSVAELAVISVKELSELTGMSEEHALKLTQAAREVLGLDFMTAEEYYNKRSKLGVISTGCKALDDLLGGGIETQAITEFVGEFGTGKTQICHQLAVMVQLPKEKGGLGGRAVYIDTEGTFRPERIIQIAKYRGLEPKTTLKNILLASAKTFAEEYSLISSIERLDKSYKLLIVDTLTSPLQVEYADDVVTRRWALGRLLMKLREITDREMAVIVTNRVISDPNTGEVKPLGGTLMAQGVDYRVMLYKGRKKDERIARLIYGVDVPEGEAKFRIVEYGIDDV